MLFGPAHCRQIPEWLRPTTKHAVEHLPKDFLLELGRSLPGGFSKLPAIVALLDSLTHSYEWVPTAILDWVALESPATTVLQTLEFDAASSQLSSLLRVLGTPTVALALWLDPRPNWQALASPNLPHHEPDRSPEGARAWLEFVSHSLLEPCGIEDLKGGQLTPSTTATPTVKPVSPTTPLASALSEDRPAPDPHGPKRLKELERKLAAAETAHRQEKQDWANQLALLQTQRQSTEQALHQLQQQFRQQVDEELARQLSAQLRPWLARPLVVETALDPPDPKTSAESLETLLRSAEAAVARQSQVDRQRGNVAQLRQEIRRLEDQRESVQLALTDALHPTGELPAILRRLDEAIARRRTALGELPSGAPWVRELAGQIAGARKMPELEAVQSRIQWLLREGLLSEESAKALLGRAAERRSALLDAELQRTPIAPVRLSDVLQGKAAALLLVDAFNWIGQSAFELGVSGDPAHFSESLRTLRPWMKTLARGAALAEIRFVADGPREGELPLSRNLRLEWSGGTGSDRADGVIIDWVAAHRGAEPVWVVTADQEVERRCRQLGAVVESPMSFTRRVQHLFPELRPENRRPSEA